MADDFQIYKDGDTLIAVVIKSGFREKGRKFFTAEDSPQQLGYIHYAEGAIVRPHVHNVVKREVFVTQEIVFVKKGRLKVDLYKTNRRPLASCELESGDLILHAGGGYGAQYLEDTEIILIKQGPYAGKRDKTYFDKS